jgi:hypothetical protein
MLGVPGALPLSYAGLFNSLRHAKALVHHMHLCDVDVVMPPVGIDPTPFF